MRTLSPAEIPRGYPTWFGPTVDYLLAAVAVLLAGWFVRAG